MLIQDYLILKIFKKYIKQLQYSEDNDVFFIIGIINLVLMTKLLSYSLLFNIQSLINISAVDWIWRKKRFGIYYSYISYFFNYRVFLVVNVPVYLRYPYGLGVESLSFLYSSAAWLEREIWDLFGIFFYNHVDLRRILTDYGFQGFPFRKDFPLVGFKELRYDDTTKLIVFENVKLVQDYRSFNFINPWK